MPLTRARLRISDYNENRKSRLKNQERRIRAVSLSLTSMVDMFAILVIFLLTNSSSVTQWLELGHDIDLPKAKHSEAPPKGATLQVSRDGVFNETNKKLSSISAIQQGETSGVRGYLSKQNKKEGYVNIVADNKIHFGVIRKLVGVCQQAGFKNVNLAVVPKFTGEAK